MNAPRRILLAGLLAAAVAACKPGVSASPYAALDDRAEALRARFNQDVGQVRVVMLVAPT